MTATEPADAPDCPRWLQFLEEATGGDVELVRFLRQLVGYCLTGVTTEQVLAFIHGLGGNGKSVFVNTVQKILGEYARVAAIETFTSSHNDRHPEELARLASARMVTASETDSGRRWAEGRVKMITGGDTINARFYAREQLLVHAAVQARDPRQSCPRDYQSRRRAAAALSDRSFHSQAGNARPEPRGGADKGIARDFAMGD